jgi:hypothetical protein
MEKELTKNEMKSLVKECLLEILIEGVGGESSNLSESRQARPPTNSRVQQAPTRRPSLDMIRPRAAPSAAPAPQPPRSKPNPANYKELVGGNDVMASIFADTAGSGLVESLNERGSAHSNPVIDTGVDPTLFEGAGNWAALAFSEPPSKRNFG